MALASGAAIPTTDENGNEFLGSLDGYWTTEATPQPLTEAAKQHVLRRIENAGGFFKLDRRIFCHEGSRLLHAWSSTVRARGCSWGQADQEALFDALGLCPLPQETEILVGCKVLAVLPQENWFVQEAEYYNRLVADKESAIIEGREKLMTAPQMPVKTASAEPTKD